NTRCQYQLQKHNKLVVFFTNQPFVAQNPLQLRAKSIAQHFRCAHIHEGSMNSYETNIKGAGLYQLNIPSLGRIDANLTGLQALKLIADLERQLNERIPRSLRVEPITIAEIDARDAIQQARKALSLALKGSAVTIILSEAIDALDRVLSPSEGQS
ncbi:MAG: hypothetical protein EB119_09695, partial [Synechococcaceae bacterium WBB_34_004]|nr:hypothetical protein [Synechococcaceae bacterium WBB_34_004]